MGTGRAIPHHFVVRRKPSSFRKSPLSSRAKRGTCCPVARHESRGWSCSFRVGLFLHEPLTYFLGARYPSGKGEVCKTFMRRFDSDPRLQITSESPKSSPTPKSSHSPNS